MTLTSTLPRNSVISEKNNAIRWQSEKIGLLYGNEQSEDDVMGDIQENILDHEGQFLSLNLAEPLMETFPEMFYAALKNASWDRSMHISLPVIMQHNPHIASQFLNHAIHWQRLCDLVIMDDDPDRKTVMILENADQASSAVQREIARLIRFHSTHSIHRTFVFTLNAQSHNPLIPELRTILGI